MRASPQQRQPPTLPDEAAGMRAEKSHLVFLHPGHDLSFIYEDFSLPLPILRKQEIFLPCLSDAASANIHESPQSNSHPAPAFCMYSTCMYMFVYY
ncbi:50S ribosomal protein [Histoplasma capsulatum G186AR]|uniref:50S ribosomal protein n=1 Tax=Ajellomyces capsulatus TaxID=5037 RepID=A0A8H7Z650_AJECA|nr:50S ribosomal protein [Histoplasma capsulatum]QSS70270.1 50S ribosomal protein [Histoplasma capsulatum G186AR]